MDRSCGQLGEFLGKTLPSNCGPLCCSRDSAAVTTMQATDPAFRKMPPKPSSYNITHAGSNHTSPPNRQPAAHSLPSGSPMFHGGARQSNSPPASNVSPSIPPRVNGLSSLRSTSPANVGPGDPSLNGSSASREEMCIIIARSRLCQGLIGVQLLELLSHMKHHRSTEGRYIVRQGEKASSMFFVLSGQVSVDVGGKPVATLCKGDFFGESALCTMANQQLMTARQNESLQQQFTRNADCRALTDVELIELDAAALAPLLTKHQDLFDNFNSVLQSQSQSLNSKSSPIPRPS